MKKEVKVLLFGKTSQAKKEIEALFHEVQINLENNYKDLAISARKQAEVKLAEYQAAGELKEKEYICLYGRYPNSVLNQRQTQHVQQLEVI